MPPMTSCSSITAAKSLMICFTSSMSLCRNRKNPVRSQEATETGVGSIEQAQSYLAPGVQGKVPFLLGVPEGQKGWMGRVHLL